MFLSPPPRPLVVKPSVLQLQQFGIPSHSVSGNHHLLAPSNVISKLIYLPSPASPFPHPATPAPLTRACLQFVRYTNFVIIINNNNTNNERQNLNKHSKRNINLTNMQKCKYCSLVCAYHCAQLSYTIQHRAVLNIFPLIIIGRFAKEKEVHCKC